MWSDVFVNDNICHEIPGLLWLISLQSVVPGMITMCWAAQLQHQEPLGSPTMEQDFRPFSCDNCDKRYLRKNNLEDHVLMEHPESEQVIKYSTLKRLINNYIQIF